MIAKTYRREEKAFDPVLLNRIVAAWNAGISTKFMSERFGLTGPAVRAQLARARKLGLHVDKRDFRRGTE